MQLAVGVALAVQVAVSVAGWSASNAEVADDNRVIARVARDLGRDDGLIAPWTWGVRVSLVATGDPYALAWRVPGAPVRDQARLCGRRFARVAVLPPGATIAGVTRWRVDEDGVRWLIPADEAALDALPGCH